MREPKVETRIVKVPLHDTGLGQEAGYRNDAELLAAAETERAKLPPEVREAVKALERDIQRAFLFGSGR